MNTHRIRTALGSLLAAGALVGGIAAGGESAQAASCDWFVPGMSNYQCEDSDYLYRGLNLDGDSAHDVWIQAKGHWFLRNGTQDQWRLRVDYARVCVGANEAASATGRFRVFETDGDTRVNRARTLNSTQGVWPFAQCRDLITPGTVVTDPGGPTSLSRFRVNLNGTDFNSNLSTSRSAVPEGN